MLADDILATKLGTAIDFYRMSSLYPPAEVPSSITDQFEEATRFHVPPCPAYDKFREVACGPWGQHRYRGEVNDAWEPHGHGILMDMNTGVAQFSQRAKGGKSGRFVNGLPQGDIYSEYPDGTRVNAWYDQGRVVCGTVSKADGRRYVGELAWDCVAHGKGSLFLPEHDAWAEGSFALDAREGPCKITFGDGKVVEAEFKADKIVQGLVTYKGGTWYKGELEGEGVPHGKGEIYDPEEDVVESGVFEHGRRQGIFVSDRKVSTFCCFCCVVYEHGRRQGIFVSDRKVSTFVVFAVSCLSMGGGRASLSVIARFPRLLFLGCSLFPCKISHGTSQKCEARQSPTPKKLTPQNQQKNVKFHGTYRDDDLVYGKFIYPNGEVREGPMLHGKINGIGRLVHAQKHIVYHGSFRDGYFNGKGKLYMHGALVYEGDFQHDKPHGMGRQTPIKGCMCVGDFQNGVLHGMVSVCFVCLFFWVLGLVSAWTKQRVAWECSDSFQNTQAEITNVDEQGRRFMYKGAVRHGQNTGFAVLEDYKGSYRGYFLDGYRHGHGCQVYNDGTRQEGIWRRGVFVLA